MKWIGWVFAVALLVIFIVVQHGAHKRLADARADVDAAVAEETAKVDAVFERAEEGIPARRERLAAETAKTTELETQRDQLAAKKSDLETRLASLSKSTDQLREAKGTLTDTQQENLEQIRELQEQLAKLETQSQLLERALLMVTEKKDF
jgi:chromosome segregation ATPase